MIAFELPGGLPIYLDALLLGLSACLGLAWSAWEGRLPRQDVAPILDAGLWALVGGLICGRAGYIALHWSYFQVHRSEWLAVSQGGLAWAASLGGALAAVLCFALLTQRSFGGLLDALVPFFLTVAIGAWLICWLDGCAYGPPLDTWWALPAGDLWGTLALRWPTQFVGAVLTLALAWLLNRCTALYFHPGWKACLGLLGLAALNFSLSFVRADPGPAWRGLRLDAWLSLALALSAVILLILFSMQTGQSAEMKTFSPQRHREHRDKK